MTCTGFVKHFIYSRLGGVSRFPFDSLNTSFDVGDDVGCVKRNRSIVLNFSGGKQTVYVKQVHGSRVLLINKKNLLSSNVLNSSFCHADAIITDVPGVNIAIQTADCQVVMIVDSSKKVIANVHVGWRGNICNILGKTVEKMIRCFGCKPLDMIAVIGPSLGPCCSEFLNYRREIPEVFFDYKMDTYRFDFWKISRDQLLSVGLSLWSIHCCNICTKCNSETFFSFRKNKITGRFVTLLRICSSK